MTTVSIWTGASTNSGNIYPGVIQVEYPLTGATLQIYNITNKLMIVPLGTLATLIIGLPQNPVDQQQIEIFSSQDLDVVTLRITDGSTSTINGTQPLIIFANSSVTYTYVAQLNQWWKA